MAQRKELPPDLNVIPGLSVEDILHEKAEFIITLKYLTKKQEKTYRLVAGKTGLRFELNSYRAI
ncbi:hypothetical protein ACFL6S_10200 [Candidatus Poribacteria bacterium]